MRYTLSSGLAVLNSYVKSVGFVDTFQCSLNPCYSVEYVGDLLPTKVRELRLNAKRTDKDMAWEEWLDVHHGEAVARQVEDL